MTSISHQNGRVVYQLLCSFVLSFGRPLRGGTFCVSDFTELLRFCWFGHFFPDVCACPMGEWAT